MKSSFGLRRFTAWLAGVILTLGASSSLLTAADPAPASATVTGLRGLAQYSKGGGGYIPLKVGTVLHAGDVVQTANGSALDLDFGKETGTVRLLQSTTLSLTTLGGDAYLDLKGGEVLGQLKARPDSRLRIEVPVGVVGIVQGDFRLSAMGYFVLLEGTAVYVESRSEGDPVAFTLKGGKPSFYSPTTRTVQPAPKELERDVRSQLKARLPKK